MGVGKYILVLGTFLHSQWAFAIWQCSEDLDCGAMSGSFCSNGACVCPLGTQSVLGGSACAEVAPYYHSPCFEDFQCSPLQFNFRCRKAENAGGEAGVCECQSDHHYVQGRCWPSRRRGESCERDVECMSLLRDHFSLSCHDGVCECSEGYYLRQRGECRKESTAVGESCVINEDCRFENGACHPSLLTCMDLSDSNAESFTELSLNVSVGRSLHKMSLVRQHGQPCDGSCADPFVCSSLGVCTCPIGYYPNAAGTLCLALIGSPVTSESQCEGFFKEVRDGFCVCEPNYYFDDDMRECVKAASRLENFCFSDVACQTFGAFTRCVESDGNFGLRSCECIPEETVWNNVRQMCSFFGGIGGQCEENSDCIAGNLEILCQVNNEGVGVCTCPPEHEPVGDLCLRMGLGLGESCQATEECADTPNAICSGGTCICEEGYQSNEGVCAPVIGGSCEEDANCVIENTVCESTTNTCQCTADYVEYEDNCWPESSGHGSQCNISVQCVPSLGSAGICTNGSCTCDETHHYSAGECLARIGLFETCTRASECFLGDITDRVQCRNGLCQCSFDFPYSEELRTCTSSGIVYKGDYLMLLAALIYLYFS